MLKDNFITADERTPLSMKWYDIEGKIEFDIKPADRAPAGWYRFTAPPGLKNIIIRSTGRFKVFIDGKPQRMKSINYRSQSAFLTVIGNEIPNKSVVAIRVEQTRGNYGGAAFPEPILLNCEKGIIQTGDWSQGSVLENYSGGAWYRKNIVLSEEQVRTGVILDLGKVVATAEVHVNDSLAGILVTSPWKVDISKWIKQGLNKIEVLVYNTLANHYLTIPTKYRGSSLLSGLIGPVKLEFEVLK
jgi:hypothetical protein